MILFLGSIRVSNELGGGQPQAARQSVRAIFVITVVEGLLVALATILLRNVWGYLYSNEVEVVNYVSTMMPVLAVSDFLDGIQCALSGRYVIRFILGYQAYKLVQ